MNNSPWIDQLKKTRQPQTLADHFTGEVAIIGAGIAGVSTAYFTLKNTQHHVILIEANRTAHGATGHNAGQIVSYFERQLSELVKQYGVELAAEAQRAIQGAWELVDEIYADTKLKTPLYQFDGYAGCQDFSELLVHLENSWYYRQANLVNEPIFIADKPELLAQIPERYAGLYTVVEAEKILELLQTQNSHFFAAIQAKKGCMNSALFCEDLLDYLLVTYPDRFLFVEESPVSEITLDEHKATLTILNFEVTVSKVVLCTNGFENFTITNRVGPDINTQFHHLVSGRVGYMAAYLEAKQLPPVAISYLSLHQEGREAEPYFYLTRRPFEDETGPSQRSLICIGGPESELDDSSGYQRTDPYQAQAQTEIDAFLHRSYRHTPPGKIEYLYRWHGLMGYTPSRLRCIGPEPLNPILLYNLGCNGVGILPSIYGGKKIAHFLNNEQLAPSLFDPQISQHDAE